MINKIEKYSHQFSFFQAVSLLEKHYQAIPELAFKGVGKNRSFSREYIRFSVSASLAFPKSDIDFIRQFEIGGQHYTQVEVNFLGLHGSSSPLPCCYIEKLAGREESENPVKQFFDFFHHRYISMLYQVWKKYRYHTQYQSGATDPFSGRMLNLLGVSTVMQQIDAADLDRAKLLSYINQLSTRTRSPKLLSGIVAHYFSLSRVRIEQWIYRRIAIPNSQKNQLNRRNCNLGNNLHLGGSVPDLVGKFNLCIDDIDFKTYQAFLPGGKNYPILLGLMRFILRDPVVWDLKMRLTVAAIPLNHLGRGGLLGQTTWLGNPTAQHAQTRLIGSL